MPNFPSAEEYKDTRRSGASGTVFPSRPGVWRAKVTEIEVVRAKGKDNQIDLVTTYQLVPTIDDDNPGTPIREMTWDVTGEYDKYPESRLGWTRLLEIVDLQDACGIDYTKALDAMMKATSKHDESTSEGLNKIFAYLEKVVARLKDKACVVRVAPRLRPGQKGRYYPQLNPITHDGFKKQLESGAALLWSEDDQIRIKHGGRDPKAEGADDDAAALDASSLDDLDVEEEIPVVAPDTAVDEDVWDLDTTD